MSIPEEMNVLIADSGFSTMGSPLTLNEVFKIISHLYFFHSTLTIL